VREVVWVDEWQMACCGEPFAVGASVEWSVRRDIDRRFLADAVGEELARTVTAWEEHHHEGSVRVESLHGAVSSMVAVSCRYALNSRGTVREPLPGTAAVVECLSTEALDEKGRLTRDPERVFLGWIVELDVSSAYLPI
jgi:hypothetical protein